MNKPKPKIWVLLGARAGDNAQALELAQRLGGTVERKPLRFNRLSDLPNFVLGAGFKTLTDVAALSAPWPDVVIATGRRAAPVSLAIKAASGQRSVAVHLGRPRMRLGRFDLVLSTPQYGLPPAPNVMKLLFPFAQAKAVLDDLKSSFASEWSHLPHPWIAGVIGAGKFPLRFGTEELDGFAAALDRLAKDLGGSVILMDSPRSAAGAIQRVAGRVTSPHWMWTRGIGDNPYQAALALSDQFAVTSDSVSMVSEMVQTGKPVHVFHLPVSAIAPRWSAQTGVAAWLARHGVLSPPRNVATLHGRLEDRGWTGDLGRGVLPSRAFQSGNEHALAVERINDLLRQRVMG